MKNIRSFLSEFFHFFFFFFFLVVKFSVYLNMHIIVMVVFRHVSTVINPFISADQYKYEPSHQDLHCLPFGC